MSEISEMNDRLNKDDPYLFKGILVLLIHLVEQSNIPHEEDPKIEQLSEPSINNEEGSINRSIHNALSFKSCNQNTNETNRSIQRKINSLRTIGWVFEFKRQKWSKSSWKLLETKYKNLPYKKIKHVYYKTSNKSSFNSNCERSNKKSGNAWNVILKCWVWSTTTRRI